MVKDSTKQYGSVSKLFHWVMAILVGWQLFKFGDRIVDGEHWVGQTLVPWHVSIGSLFLLLVVARIVWTLSQRKHRPVQNPATATLVKTGHFLLYACMVLLPVTAIMLMVGNGYGLTAFGMQIVPRGEEIAWAASLGTLHSPLAWIFAALLIGHIGIAFIHHFVKRDDTLKRML